ncbi:thioredoxin-dependent thiol peroxidase [Rheinheimera sediminis]|uniref:thioredoxin-dependent thiol peroxidase n=1 Tax=Rheinheimera sp. YQF-1 TaxID=2499626 RepID=UPI000FD8A375|nr:thioredoxin-dependent thiol peroxidase [Rheinheimera sp. YQF-1]RVT49171.1 thioredoxin-dependent thiol peroxidase [Rheinheimera sp. YQF-1]
MNRLTTGQTAPDFSLPDQSGQLVQLSTLLQKSRVLVYFYPKAMTPGCTVQACGLRDSKQQLADFNVQVVGISIDAPARLAKFVQKEQLNFKLLGDEDHKIAEAFGVWGEKKFMGKIYDGIHRISFLIEQDGKVSQVFDDFKTSNHHDVVLAYLKSTV